MTDHLSFQVVRRQSDGTPGVRREWNSVDFLVGGRSLLQTLVAVHGSHGDFAGCFARESPELNRQRRNEFLCIVSPPLASGRVLLYVCPECGDLGCGAYAARVACDDTGCTWSDFAFENGYEVAQPLQSIGPFHFSRELYEKILGDACAV